MGKITFWKKIISFVFFSILRLFVYRIKLEERQNLRAIKAHLKEGSAVIIFNHNSFDDAFVVLTLIYFKLRKQIRRIIIPGSRKHWLEPRLGRIMRLSPLIGLEVFPVVQHYERDLVSKAETRGLDREFLRVAREVLSTKGGVILFAPEGHRGEGQLQPFRKGVDTLTGIICAHGLNAVIVPVGIKPPEGVSRGINPFKKFRVSFGLLLYPTEVREVSKTSGMSVPSVFRERIAELLTTE